MKCAANYKIIFFTIKRFVYLQNTDLSNLLQTSIITQNKTNTMTGALQLLQSAVSNETPTTSPNLPFGAMDSLSDSELKTLLQNFKDLSTEEQHSLITYLKKLEAREPDRVERLRKFVNLGSSNTNPNPEEKSVTSTASVRVVTGRSSPFASRERETGANPSLDEEYNVDEVPKNPSPVPPVTKVAESSALKIDSDEDEDYSFEDVFRAASKNVNDKQKLEEECKKENDKQQNLTDTKMLIANLMGQLGGNKNNNFGLGLNLLGLGTPANQPIKSLPVESPSSSNTSFSTVKPSPSPTAAANNNPFPNNFQNTLSSSNSNNINLTPQQNYPQQLPSPFGFTNNRPFNNTNFDNNYGGQNYSGNNQYPQQNIEQPMHDFNSGYPGSSTNFGQQQNNMQPRYPGSHQIPSHQQHQQFNRGPPPNQYQYDGRQNYY